MKKNPLRSLQADLLVDLSLLTLCALLLSEALMIILLRVKVPEELTKFTQANLKVASDSFLAQGSDLKKWDEKSAERFTQFIQNSGMPDPTAWSLRLVKGEISHAGEFGIENSKLFGLVSYVSGVTRQVQGAGGILVFQVSMDQFQEMITHFKLQVFVVTLIIEILLVLFAYFLLFRRNILLPIGQLSRVAQEFLKENWDARFEVDRHDELANIGGALNEMAQKIQEKEKKLVLTIESLKSANEELEVRQNEQLQIEKLASIGRLAAGVAHEVGNPLGAISGYVDILRRALKKLPSFNPEDVELLDRIEAETNRISKIIRALLQQARPTKDRIHSVKLKPLLKRCLDLAQLPPSIELEFDFEDELAEVMAEEDQLVQVFLNLILNARHAIEAKKDRLEPGKLKLRCRNRKLPVYRTASDQNDYDTSVVRALKPEVYWVLSIEDNGIGISEDDQKKLFEPFFSTKAPGKGTGLGLYVTKSIIESFRGAIVVRSAPGYGASFSVFLPRARDLIA